MLFHIACTACCITDTYKTLDSTTVSNSLEKSVRCTPPLWSGHRVAAYHWEHMSGKAARSLFLSVSLIHTYTITLLLILNNLGAGRSQVWVGEMSEMNSADWLLVRWQHILRYLILSPLLSSVHSSTGLLLVWVSVADVHQWSMGVCILSEYSTFTLTDGLGDKQKMYHYILLMICYINILSQQPYMWFRKWLQKQKKILSLSLSLYIYIYI